MDNEKKNSSKTEVSINKDAGTEGSTEVESVVIETAGDNGATGSNVEVNVKKGKSNTGLIIAVVVVFFICLCCIGVGFVASQAANTSLTRYSDNIIENTIYETIEREVENSIGEDADINLGIRGNATLPQGFPNDVPIYEGSKITSSFRNRSSNGEGFDYSVILSVSGADINDVVGYYRDELADAGWELESDSEFGGFFIQGYTKDEARLSMSFSDIEGTIGVTISVSDVD